MSLSFTPERETVEAAPSPELPALDAGVTVADRFVVDGRIQSGGMSTVYAARRIDGGLPVALKVAARGTTPLADHSLAVEARALGRVRHPNVVRERTFGVDGSIVYLEMERLRGYPLSEHLVRRTIPFPEVLRVFSAVARALAAAHRVGIAHRDIKPSNVILEPTGRCVLIDFGIAVGDGVAAPRSDVVCGTPGTMAPEVVLGQARDRAAFELADQYALAVLLVAMLAPSRRSRGVGGVGGVGGDGGAAGAGLCDEHWRRRVAPELTRTIERALAVEPSARYADVEAFRTAVVGLVAGDRVVETELVDRSGAIPCVAPIVPTRRMDPSEQLRSA
jgi:serine/threonine protein kinase